MALLSRLNGTLGPVGRRYTNPLSLGLGGSTQTYTKNGQTWRSHTFTSSGTFVVYSNTQPFTVLCVSGGQGGGYCHPADCRPNGSAGPAVVSTSITPVVGNISVTVGAGGGGGAGTHQSGAGGGTSAFGSYLNSGSGSSVTSDVQAGTNVTYANGTYGYGGAAVYLSTGQTGGPGVVIIAYRLA